MDLGNFEFIISSPDDREFLVTELHYLSNQIAEANVEKGKLVLEIYPRPHGGPWEVPAEILSEFLRYSHEKLFSSANPNAADA